MNTIKLKDGSLFQHNHSERMVGLATKWLRGYFSDGLARRPGDMEDDLCGEPSIEDIAREPLGAWMRSPFYPALTLLVDSGEVEYAKDRSGDIWYAMRGRLPNDARN